MPGRTNTAARSTTRPSTSSMPTRRSSATTSRATSAHHDLDLAGAELCSLDVGELVGVGEEDDVVGPLADEQRVVDRTGMEPSTPRGWSLTSQPWQYGQCRRSRPHRSRTPGRSGMSSLTPVVTSTRRAVSSTPRGRRTTKDASPRSAAPIVEGHHGALEDLDSVAGDLGSTGRQQLGGRHPVAGQKAVHVRGGRVAGSAGVDDGDPASGTAQHQCCAEACSSAADDHDVVVRCVHGDHLRHERPPDFSNPATVVAVPGTRGELPRWRPRRPWPRFWPKSDRGCGAFGTSEE